jgi:hypothetical protein
VAFAAKPAGYTPVNSAPFVSYQTLLQEQHALLLAIVQTLPQTFAVLLRFDPRAGAVCLLPNASVNSKNVRSNVTCKKQSLERADRV